VYKYHQKITHIIKYTSSYVHQISPSTQFTKFTNVHKSQRFTKHIIRYDTFNKLSILCNVPRHDSLCMWYRTPSRSSPHIQLYHIHHHWIQSILITVLRYKYPTYECMNIWPNNAYVQTTPHQHKHWNFSYTHQFASPTFFICAITVNIIINLHVRIRQHK